MPAPATANGATGSFSTTRRSLDRFHAAGATPEEIDFVLRTHVDHVGWNARLENGRWVPTFPHAKYVFARSELDFWPPSVLRDLQGAELRHAKLCRCLAVQQSVEHVDSLVAGTKPSKVPRPKVAVSADCAVARFDAGSLGGNGADGECFDVPKYVRGPVASGFRESRWSWSSGASRALPRGHAP